MNQIKTMQALRMKKENDHTSDDTPSRQRKSFYQDYSRAECHRASTRSPRSIVIH